MSFLLRSICFVFVLNILNTFASPTRHLCRPDEKNALLEFVNEFEIRNLDDAVFSSFSYPKTNSWSNKSDCCSWDGITCHAKSGEVVELDLSSSCFHGKLSSKSSLFKLQRLRVLNLAYNDLVSSEIPSQLGTLKELTLLNLSNTLSSGPIPTELLHLTKLVSLDLSSNSLSAQKSFLNNLSQNLTNLEELNLGLVDISSEIPPNISKLSSLKSLSLDECNLFVLSSNRLSGQIPPSFANLNQLTTLKTFEASENIFTGTLPSTLFNTPSLTYIDLKDNQLNAILEFGNISSPSKLERLSLGNNHFKGSLPISISSLLIVLDLSSNAFQGPLFDPPVSTEALVVSNNNFTGKIPESICEQRYLQTLDLSNNSFTGSIPQCLKNLNSYLSFLILHHNQLNGSIPEIFTNATDLVSIDVSQNRLVGKLPRSLKSCTSLEVLNVRSNGIDDTFPFWLNTLPELKVIVLRNNNFKGPLHHYFSDWNMTRREDRSGVIYIRYNDYYHDSMVLMSKGVEMKLERILKLLTAIDLSGNELSGKIPESIGLLKDLIVLNLSSNGFTGDIPSSFGNQSQLESLDLSNNKLSGSIPPSLGDLSSLSYIKVSNNQLHGPIPQSTQFQTQSASSFEGNLGLCGLPLSEKCGEQSQEPEAEEAEEEEGVLSWTAAAIALAPGVILGLTIGHILVTQKTHWFMRFLA
ncbi:BnaA02g30090D [Brassica napus]|uniref:BnaA02g30090D protein n=1 Tax=Brassica napus TaxID=3708 RepID=A0A078IHZ0_BRANA|nr:BnaA02g30090D [Brassica napus]